VDISLLDELSAINFMLESIGSMPVASLEDSGVADVAIANFILKQTSREVQSEGWQFNSDTDIEYTPDIDGYITFGANILRVTPTYRNVWNCDVALRGQKLYDRRNKTFVFTQSLKLDTVTFLAWTDLPETARNYIALKASRRFAQKVLGADSVCTWTEADEKEARRVFEEYEGDTAKYNILMNNPGLRR